MEKGIVVGAVSAAGGHRKLSAAQCSLARRSEHAEAARELLRPGHAHAPCHKLEEGGGSLAERGTVSNQRRSLVARLGKREFHRAHADRSFAARRAQA
jgi:hypothetical protein